MTLTKAQRQALKKIHQRIVDETRPSRRPTPYRQFRRSCAPAFFDGVIMVPFAGMWLGVERDGYTHSGPSPPAPPATSTRQPSGAATAP